MKALLSRAAAWLRTLWRGVVWLVVRVLGHWHWDAPAWVTWSRAQSGRGWRYLGAKPWRGAVVAVVVAAAVAGAVWYKLRPKPHYVGYTVNEPGLTEYDEKGISSIKVLTISFDESAAPLKQVQKPVTSGIDVSPALPGTWYWNSDKELQFTPRDDWPVDGRFAVRFVKNGLFASQVVLENYRFTFKSQPFSASIADSQFYQDPRDPNLKKLVATLKFTHPVDTAQLESHVSLAVAKDADYLGLGGDSRHFTVIYDKFKLSAFVHSSALAMPRDDTPMTLRVDKGVRAARGGNETRDRLESVVVIPGRTSLRFSEARMTIVDNAKYEPEQILMINSSSPVAERAFGNNVTVRLLPVRHPRQSRDDRRPYEWTNEDEIGNDILGTSDPVSVAYVPSEEGGNTAHGFKFLRQPAGTSISSSRTASRASAATCRVNRLSRP
jgi:hypothetical protein